MSAWFLNNVGPSQDEINFARSQQEAMYGRSKHENLRVYGFCEKHEHSQRNSFEVICEGILDVTCQEEGIAIGRAAVALPGEVVIGPYNLGKLQEQIESLQSRVQELETILLYAPGGSGYEAAREHFEGLANSK